MTTLRAEALVASGGIWGLNRAQKGLNEITELPTPVPPMGVRIGRLWCYTCAREGPDRHPYRRIRSYNT